MSKAEEIARDGWLNATCVTLGFCGLCYLPLIIIGPIQLSYMSNHASLAEHNLKFVVTLIVFAIVCGGVFVASMVTAWGIRRGKRWAWIMGVVFGGLYLPSCCLPFGAMILYGLLRENSRRLFET